MNTDHTDTVPQMPFVERRSTPRHSTDQPNHSVWRGGLNEAAESLEISIESEIGAYDPYDTGL